MAFDISIGIKFDTTLKEWYSKNSQALERILSRAYGAVCPETDVAVRLSGAGEPLIDNMYLHIDFGGTADPKIDKYQTTHDYVCESIKDLLANVKSVVVISSRYDKYTIITSIKGCS